MSDTENALARLSAKSKARVQIKAVEVEGETIHVRTITGAERTAYEVEGVESSRKGKSFADNYKARLVYRALCDEEGKRLAVEGDVKSLRDIEELDPNILQQLYEAADEVNPMGKARAIEIEDEGKKS